MARAAVPAGAGALPLLAPTSDGRPRAVRVPDEPRVAVAAVVEEPNADLTIATAHLSFVPGYNTRQLLELRAFLAGMPRPMVLLGDFNTPGGVPGLVTGWDQVARVPTYPVLRPRIQFDHIMADGWTAEALDAGPPDRPRGAPSRQRPLRTRRRVPGPLSHCSRPLAYSPTAPPACVTNGDQLRGLRQLRRGRPTRPDRTYTKLARTCSTGTPRSWAQATR